MEITSLFLMLCVTCAAAVSVRPSRTQFFQYERIVLICAEDSSGWTVRRNTSSKKFQSCNDGWGVLGTSSCTSNYVYPLDSGVYWCESQQGECSSSINITVTDGVVILKSPSSPVTEGEKVTLQCVHKERNKEEVTSDFSAAFHKDGVFIGTEAAGMMTLPKVSTSHQGFYECEHPSKGKSPRSWLTVRGRAPTSDAPPTPSPPPPVLTLPRVLCIILLLVLYTLTLIVCSYKCRKWVRARADAKTRASDEEL